MALIEHKQTYNFRTLAPAIIGDLHTGMKVLSIMSTEQAMKESPELVTTHNILRSYISGLPSSVNACTFYLFEKMDGTRVVMALEYIDPFSIKDVSVTNLKIDVLKITTDDVAIIRASLMSLGYKYITLTPYTE